MANSTLELQQRQNPETGAARRKRGRAAGQPLIVLSAILSAYLLLESLLPLGRAVKIGADEDFELSKATLFLHGHKLYTEVWDDQPPLITFVVANVLKHVSRSILAARMVSVISASLLLCAVFMIARRLSGVFPAALTAIMLAASPGFIDLSSSCMQEIPALAPVLAGLCALFTFKETRFYTAEVAGACLFAIGLQMKLIGMIYFPVAGFILWLRVRERGGVRGRVARSMGVFAVVCAATFLAINFLLGAPFLEQVRQSWGAHFAAARSFEYGSPQEHPFDWGILVRNWDATVPALLGIVLLARGLRLSRAAALPLLWLALTLVIFPSHKPWWTYYYVHNSIPLCWCAAIGLVPVCRGLTQRGWLFRVLCGALLLGAAGWASGRVYLQERGIRALPRLSSCLVLKEVERFKPYTSFLFSDDPIFSFYADIPMPPRLATISLKEMWSGRMSNEQAANELSRVKPGLILGRNDGRQRPYQELLNREYKLVYRDGDYLLYAHSSISKEPVF